MWAWNVCIATSPLYSQNEQWPCPRKTCNLCWFSASDHWLSRQRFQLLQHSQVYPLQIIFSWFSNMISVASRSWTVSESDVLEHCPQHKSSSQTQSFLSCLSCSNVPGDVQTGAITLDDNHFIPSSISLTRSSSLNLWVTCLDLSELYMDSPGMPLGWMVRENLWWVGRAGTGLRESLAENLRAG